MKRSNSTSSSTTISPSSRRAKRSNEIPDLPLDIWTLIFRYLKHGGEKEGRITNASLVSKVARRLVFECATKIELQKKRYVKNYSDDVIVLSPSTAFLLPEFENATYLRVSKPHKSWRQSKEEIGWYVSKLRKLTDLHVAIGVSRVVSAQVVSSHVVFDAIIAPSSVPCPEKLLNLTIRTGDRTDFVLVASGGAPGFDTKKGISRFSNLERLELQGGSAAFLGNYAADADSDLEGGGGGEDNANAESDKDQIPPLSNLSTLDLRDVSDVDVLSDSWLTLTALKSLEIMTITDGFDGISAATLAPLVSLTELSISIDEGLELAFGGSLNSLTNLKTLRLENWKISGEDVSNLFELTKLSLIGKCYDDFFDRAGLEDALTGLRSLNLFYTQATHLPKFEKLTRLKLCGEEHMEPLWIERLPSLVSLSLLFETPFEKGGIEALTKLRALKLHCTSISASRGAMQLAGLTRLKAVCAEPIIRGVESEFPNLKRSHIV